MIPGYPRPRYMLTFIYVCETCQVGGEDENDPPACWNCGSTDVTITARPQKLPEQRGPAD